MSVIDFHFRDQETRAGSILVIEIEPWLPVLWRDALDDWGNIYVLYRYYQHLSRENFFNLTPVELIIPYLTSYIGTSVEYSVCLRHCICDIGRHYIT